jgi:hypothetical protein
MAEDSHSVPHRGFFGFAKRIVEKEQSDIIGRGGVVEKVDGFLFDYLTIFSAFQQPSLFNQLPYLMNPVVPVYMSPCFDRIHHF